MIECPGDLVALARPQAQRRVLAGMKEASKRGPVGRACRARRRRSRRPTRARALGTMSSIRTVPPTVATRASAVSAVPHGGWWIVVDRAEVALPVDERVAQRERLRQANERVVDRGVAVRVMVAHHIADDVRRLDVRPARAVSVRPHRVEDAPVHRLQSVAHVRQGARDDHAHRIVEEARAHLLLELARLDATRAQCSCLELRHSRTLDVQELDVLRVLLDELAPRLDRRRPSASRRACRRPGRPPRRRESAAASTGPSSSPRAARRSSRRGP